MEKTKIIVLFVIFGLSDFQHEERIVDNTIENPSAFRIVSIETAIEELQNVVLDFSEFDYRENS